MYPLNALLVGCPRDVLHPLRNELAFRNVPVEGEFRDADGVISHVRSQDEWQGEGASKEQVRLLIYFLPDAADLRELHTLNSNFVGYPILALLEGEVEQRSLLRIMREGAVQIVPVPLQSDDFGEALQCIAAQFAQSSAVTRSIAISGVLGGCGATSLAINLSREMAHEAAIHAVLIELSLQMGVLASCLDIHPQHTTFDLLSDMRRVDSYAVHRSLTRICDNFDVLPGPHQTIRRLAVTSQDVLYLIDHAKKLADAVVVDLPCTYDDFYFETLAAMDQVLLVGQQTVPSVRALQLVRETLMKENHLGTPMLIINRYDPGIPGFSVQKLQELLHVDKIWTVGNDPSAFSTALSKGKTLRDVTPRSRALADVAALAKKLLGDLGHERDTSAAAPVSFFDKIVRAVGLG